VAYRINIIFLIFAITATYSGRNQKCRLDYILQNNISMTEHVCGVRMAKREGQKVSFCTGRFEGTRTQRETRLMSVGDSSSMRDVSGVKCRGGKDAQTLERLSRSRK